MTRSHHTSSASGSSSAPHHGGRHGEDHLGGLELGPGRGRLTEARAPRLVASSAPRTKRGASTAPSKVTSISPSAAARRHDDVERARRRRTRPASSRPRTGQDARDLGHAVPRRLVPEAVLVRRRSRTASPAWTARLRHGDGDDLAGRRVEPGAVPVRDRGVDAQRARDARRLGAARPRGSPRPRDAPRARPARARGPAPPRRRRGRASRPCSSFSGLRFDGRIAASRTCVEQLAEAGQEHRVVRRGRRGSRARGRRRPSRAARARGLGAPSASATRASRARPACVERGRGGAADLQHALGRLRDRVRAPHQAGGREQAVGHVVGRRAAARG